MKKPDWCLTMVYKSSPKELENLTTRWTLISWQKVLHLLEIKTKEVKDILVCLIYWVDA